MNPLEPLTDYTATVTWHDDDTRRRDAADRRFKTAGFQRGLTLTLSKKLGKGRKATLKAPAEARARRRTSDRREEGQEGEELVQEDHAEGVPEDQGAEAAEGRVGDGDRAVAKFTLGDTQFTVTPVKRKY